MAVSLMVVMYFSHLDTFSCVKQLTHQWAEVQRSCTCLMYYYPVTFIVLPEM